MTEHLKYFFRTFILLIVVGYLSGCVSKKTDETTGQTKKYSFYAMMKDGKEYLVQTDSLANGFINPEQGAKVVPAPLYYDLIVQDGNYYRVDWKTRRFIKYKIQNNVFSEVSSLELNGSWGIENYNWISRDSLMLIGFDEKASKIRYAKIQVNEMKAVQGVMQIPSPFGAFNWMSIGFSNFMNGKLYVGYTYHTTHHLNSYTTSDTIYVEVLSYPEMKSLRRFKDTRSAYPGGVNTRQSHFFTDEKGDFYFISCPGIALGNNPDKPTGIFRIRKSDEELDTNYFFNLSASPIQNHGYGFWYIGEGKAIVRTERKGLFTGMKDHYKVPQFDFYVLDLSAQTTKRLDLPLDKGTARQCVLVENGLVYITVNSEKAGNYVWIYNPKSGAFQKGLKFDDNVNYILRMERLN